MVQSTTSKLLSQAQLQLVKSDSAHLDAEILLALVMKVNRESFYAYPDYIVSQDQASDYQSLISKRTEGFPVAYLTGNKEFWSTKITVNQHTLIPRPETECLVETALELISEDSSMSILDIGTGSGAIAIAVAGERPQCSIVATDLIEETLSVAQANASHQQISSISFRQSDWFSSLKDEDFDVILCNPPYIDSQFSGLTEGEIKYEPRIALDGGYQGLEIIDHIIPASTHHLQAGGYLVLEHGYDQAKSIRHIFSLNNFIDFKTRLDYAGIDRVSYARLS